MPLRRGGVDLVLCLAILFAFLATTTTSWYVKSNIDGNENDTLYIGILRVCLDSTPSESKCMFLWDMMNEEKRREKDRALRHQMEPESQQCPSGWFRTQHNGVSVCEEDQGPIDMKWMHSCMMAMIVATLCPALSIFLRYIPEKWANAITVIAGVVLSKIQGLPWSWTTTFTVVSAFLALVQTIPVTKGKTVAFSGGLFSLIAAGTFRVKYTDLLLSDELKGGYLGFSFYSAIVGGIVGIAASLKLK